MENMILQQQRRIEEFWRLHSAVYMGTRCVACGYSLILGDFRVTLVHTYAYKWLDHNSRNTTNANLASLILTLSPNPNP